MGRKVNEKPASKSFQSHIVHSKQTANQQLLQWQKWIQNCLFEHLRLIDRQTSHFDLWMAKCLVYLLNKCKMNYLRKKTKYLFIWKKMPKCLRMWILYSEKNDPFLHQSPFHDSANEIWRWQRSDFVRKKEKKKI